MKSIYPDHCEHSTYMIILHCFEPIESTIYLQTSSPSGNAVTHPVNCVAIVAADGPPRSGPGSVNKYNNSCNRCLTHGVTAPSKSREIKIQYGYKAFKETGFLSIYGDGQQTILLWNCGTYIHCGIYIWNI